MLTAQKDTENYKEQPLYSELRPKASGWSVLS